MKKNIALVSLSIVLILTIVSIIGLFQDNRNKTTEILALQEEVQSQSAYVEDQENVNHSSTDVVDKIQFVNEAFRSYLNYTSETYQSRFTDMRDHFSGSTIEKLQGAGEGSTPEVSVESSTNSPLTYASPDTENSFVYVTDIEYQIEDNTPSTFTNIYLIEIAEEDGSFLITNVDVYSGTPTNN